MLYVWMCGLCMILFALSVCVCVLCTYELVEMFHSVRVCVCVCVYELVRSVCVCVCVCVCVGVCMYISLFVCCVYVLVFLLVCVLCFISVGGGPSLKTAWFWAENSATVP